MVEKAERAGYKSVRAKGRRGEEFAVRTLLDMGYRILAVNFHSPYGEVDIIADDGEYLCFVEVKARQKDGMVSPQQSVTRTKQNRIIKTALTYMGEHPSDLQPRFDVFSIITDSNGAVLSHDFLMGAFDGEAYQQNY